MNDQQLEDKIHQDAAKVKKDLNTLIEDSSARVGRFEDSISQSTGKAKKDLTTWVGDGISQMSEGLTKMTDDAKESMVAAASTVKKDVEHGLSQYNAKAQEVVDKVPGGFGKKAASYPWVVITISLVIGFMLGSLLKPARQPLG
jgi:ElaB/YqjD/DUF883 family membrane-anchored ribosome-binding protein